MFTKLSRFQIFKIWIISPAIIYFLISNICFANSINIGVLAYRGEQQTKTQWQPTIDYLNRVVSGSSFSLIPLNNLEIDESVKKNKLHFVITNTGNYVSLAHRYGISRLATLINKRLNKPTVKFGAVIFTHVDNQHINNLRDLKNQSFAAVHKDGFGGFQMAWYEFTKQGINPFNDFSHLTFTQFPQKKVVDLVLNKTVTAGTFRTDSLERLAASGSINLSQIKVLNQKISDDFPFLHSTDLYPEWPFSKLKHTSRTLSHNVAVALLSIKENSEAAIAANSAGWTIPLNYKPANDLMKKLNVGPYEELTKITPKKVFNQYTKWITLSGIFVTLLLASTFYIYVLNKKLRSSNDLLNLEIQHRTKLSEKLAYFASHDSLTNVYNRRAFDSFLNTEITRCLRDNRKFLVLLIDLDDFKPINDKYGHDTGDQFLQLFCQRINGTLREGDIIARLGGDEFAILCFNIDNDQSITKVKSRILAMADEPYEIADHEISSCFSMGCAVFPINGTDRKTLINHADQEMYRVKHTKT